MSTDLEFRHSLPEIRLRPIEIIGDPHEDGGAILSPNQEDDDCRTPTSDDHKIPVIPTCPPAPRKPRRVVLRKRNLSELQFFEIMGRDEVESFFRSSYQLPDHMSRNVKKRGCPNI